MTKQKMVAAVAALLLLLSGCIGGNTPATVDPAKYREVFQDNWQYRYLNDEEQECYGALYTALTDTVDRDETVTITDATGVAREHPGIRIKLPHPITEQENVTRLYNAFFRDNPQFFYVGGAYGLEGYRQNGQSYYHTLVLAYTVPAAQRNQAIARLNAAVEQLKIGRAHV